MKSVPSVQFIRRMITMLKAVHCYRQGGGATSGKLSFVALDLGAYGAKLRGMAHTDFVHTWILCDLHNVQGPCWESDEFRFCIAREMRNRSSRADVLPRSSASMPSHQKKKKKIVPRNKMPIQLLSPYSHGVCRPSTPFP